MLNCVRALVTCLALVLGRRPLLYAVHAQGGALSGFMTQPNSQYLHFVRGGFLGLSSSDAAWLGRVNYIERPYFAAQNYGDGEHGAFALAGRRFYTLASWQFSAWAGWGQMQGYMHTLSGPAKKRRRSYRVSGFTVQAEAVWQWQRFTCGVTQQSFVGTFSRSELASYVSWPFNFFLLQLAVAL